MHRTKSPQASPRLYPAACRALCPCGCSFRSRERRPGSPGAWHGRSAPARAAPAERVRGAGTCGTRQRAGVSRASWGRAREAVCPPGLRAGRRAAGSTRGAPLDPENETQHAEKSESAPRAVPQPSPRRSHLPLLKPRVRKVRRGRGRAEDEEGARSPVALPSHSRAVRTRPAGLAAERDPPARLPYLPTCGARPGRVARRLCCACPPRQRRAAGRLQPGPSAPAARRPGLARRHGNGGRGSGEVPASGPRPERAEGTERAALRGQSGGSPVPGGPRPGRAEGTERGGPAGPGAGGAEETGQGVRAASALGGSSLGARPSPRPCALPSPECRAVPSGAQISPRLPLTVLGIPHFPYPVAFL